MLSKYVCIIYRKTGLIKFYEGENLLFSCRHLETFKVQLEHRKINLDDYNKSEFKGFLGCTLIKYKERSNKPLP